MAEPKSTKAPKQKKAPEPVVDENESGTWLNSNILWGGLLLLGGSLLLLDNIDAIEVDWWSLWKLWPILIIIGGLSILQLRSWLAGVVYGATAVVTIVLAWAVLTGAIGKEDTSNTVKESFSIGQTNDKIDNLAVNIDTGASSLSISSHDGNEAVKGHIDSKFASLDLKSKIDDTTQKITLSQKRSWQWLNPGSLNAIDVQLNRQLPTDLAIDAGATKVDADLSRILLKSLEINTGVTSLDIKLGDRSDNTDVVIDTGVSSVTLRTPKHVGVKLTLDAGLSGQNLPSDFKKINDDVYQSANYDTASKKINITIDMGVSRLKLLTY